MQDSDALHARKLKVLIDITNKCNLRCVMCHFSFDKVFYRAPEHMTPEQFGRIAEALFPLAHTAVLSAGSEPTVSPHFERILEIAGRHRLPALQFLTNGLKLDGRRVDAVLNAGITQIDVSIDGATASTYERIRRGGRFDVLVSNLQRLRDEKRQRGLHHPLVQFNLTLMRSNLHELPAFVDLAEACGVERIGARHLMPYAGLDVASESLSSVAVEANAAFERFFARIEASRSVQLITFPDLFCLPDAGHGAALPESLLAHRRAHVVEPGTAGAPFGYVDLPSIDDSGDGEVVEWAGWALDSEAVDGVVLAVPRSPSSRHREYQSEGRLDGRWQELARAQFINGSRPDVAACFPGLPGNSRAGWVCALPRSSLPAGGEAAVAVHALAMNRAGTVTSLGTRLLQRVRPNASPPVCCPKPFDSIYVDANGDVYPYPDCRPDRPAGNLLRGDSLEALWQGAELAGLRAALRAGRPPAMCRDCPNLINRHVDDGVFFRERAVEERYAAIAIERLPTRGRR